VPFSLSPFRLHPHRIGLFNKLLPTDRLATTDMECKNPSRSPHRILTHVRSQEPIFRSRTKIPMGEFNGLDTDAEQCNVHTSRTREGLQRLPSVKRSIPMPVISVFGLRSSQAYTQPVRRAARSSESSLRETIRSMPLRIRLQNSRRTEAETTLPANGKEDFVRVLHGPDAEVCTGRLLRRGLPELRRHWPFPERCD
jgi:hypothetical protein